jgi:hypothetical protein
MKKSSILKWCGYGTAAAVVVAGALVLFPSKTSLSQIVLADEAKEHRILLHSAAGEHACDCYQPQIANVTISNITSTSVDVTWDCGADGGVAGPATYQVTYGTTSAKSSTYPTAMPTVTYTHHTITVPNLTPGTQYHIGVLCYCLSNCIRGGGPTVAKTFQQSPHADDWVVTTAGSGATYTISGIIGTTASGKILAKMATGITGVLVTLSGGASKTVTTAADGVYSFSGLAAGNYTVTPTKAGMTFTPASKTFANLNANQTAQIFAGKQTVGVLAEEHAAMTEVAVAKVTASDVTITWKTNIPATSMVEYGLTTTYGMKSGVNAEMVYNHDIQLFELRKGATYHARAVSYTGDDSRATYSADFAFKVPSTEDRISDKTHIMNEPNPATTWTIFSYFLYQPAKAVTIDVFTLSGKHMATLASPSSSLAEGWNKVRWDNINLNNGLYVYRINFQTPTNMQEEYKFSSLRIAK